MTTTAPGATTCPRNKAEEIAARVKYLPSLPAVVEKLLMVLNDFNTSAADIERIVATDSALAARILKLANSPLYKGVESVGTISHAVTRLGMWKLRDVAVSVATTGTLTELADEAIQRDYWHHALYTATCARVLAVESDLPLPEAPFVSGLLHDVGALVLAAVAPQDFRRYLEIPPAERPSREESVFGTTHPRIGSRLLRQWNLPRPLCDGVRMHHNEQVITSPRDPIVSLVALADMLWKINRDNHEPRFTAEVLFTTAQRANVPLERIAELLKAADGQVDQTRRDLEIAGDVSFLAPRPPARPRRIATATDHPATATWLEQCLGYLGHQVVPLATFVDDPSVAELVVFDPTMLSRMDCDLEAAMLARKSRLCVLETEKEPVEMLVEGKPLPSLGLFPTQDELGKLLRR